MVKSRVVIVCVLLAISLQYAFAQDNYYFVSFTNKLGNGFSVDQPEAYLSQRAIERRTKQGIFIEEQDLPISSSYRQSIANSGVEIFESSKWLNGIIVKATQAEADQFKSESFVEDVEYLAPVNYSGRSKNEKKLTKVNEAASDSIFQNQILGIAEMHNEGFYGQGMLVALMDGGYYGMDSAEPFDHLYSNNQVAYTYDFISKTSNVYQYSSHGTQVLSLMAAEKDNLYQGIIPEASFMLFVTENVPTEYRIEEYYWLIAAERADSAGVDVISTSVGYNTFDDPSMNYSKQDLDGITSVVSRAAHIASEKGIVVVSSAGNEGVTSWGTINFPSDIINGLAVGSIQTDYGLSIFSSSGPSADGRVKPDVVAMGSNIFVINSTGNVAINNGTSFSAPQVAGLAAGVWEAYPSMSYLDVLNAIRMSADNAASPDNDFGYGIPSFIAIKNYASSIEVHEPVLVYPNPIVNGELLTVKVVDPTKSDKIKLELFEASGKQLTAVTFGVSWRDNEAVVELKHLPQGLYFLKVLFESESEEFRIVKL